MLERAHILVCGGTGCTSGNSKKIFNEFDRLLKENKLDKEVKLIMTGCFGLCARGPIVVVYPDGAFYQHVKVADVEEIVLEHILKGRIVERTRKETRTARLSRSTKPRSIRASIVLCSVTAA